MPVSFQLKGWDKALGVCKAKLDLIARESLGELFQNIILDTPVDTGKARANWQLLIGTSTDNFLEETDPSGSATIAKAKRRLESYSAQANQSLVFLNNVPYSERLEHGWSNQAPAGMLRLNVLSFDSIVKKVSNRYKR